MAREKWTRLAPVLRLEADEARELLRPALGDVSIAALEDLSGGHSNTNVRVRLNGAPGSVVLRLYQRDPAQMRKEAAIARLVAGRAPAPAYLYCGMRASGQPYAVVEWIDGAPLQPRVRYDGFVCDAHRGQIYSSRDEIKRPKPLRPCLLSLGAGGRAGLGRSGSATQRASGAPCHGRADRHLHLSTPAFANIRRSLARAAAPPRVGLPSSSARTRARHAHSLYVSRSASGDGCESSCLPRQEIWAALIADKMGITI